VGRQLARLTVAPYHETLGSLLYPGSQTSLGTLQPLVQLAERLLRLKPHQVGHTAWRLDAGFGSDAALKWLLARHYQVLAKGYNLQRAQKVVRQVATPDWQVVRPNKWVAGVPTPVRYGRTVQTLALRWLNQAGREKCALLLHTLLDQPVMDVLHCYDARGGTIESDLQQDKLGLQLIRRRKHRWYAQEAWVILTDIGHNLLVWNRDWMLRGSSLETYGMLRTVQDVLSIPGHLEFQGSRLRQVSLQRSHPLAPEMQSCLARLFRELS
jgi:hypothetical protein